jgi:Tfp pilus assembly protein PilN
MVARLALVARGGWLDWRRIVTRLLPQAGIGIEIRGGSLHAACVRTGWKGARVTDTLEIPSYRERGPAECGKEYREFLRRNGLQAPWTVFALPRTGVLVRPLRFPAAMEKDLARAVALQVDTLHPFEPGTVAWDFAQTTPRKAAGRFSLRQQSGTDAAAPLDIVVGIARADAVVEWVEWFEAAGIPVSQFALSTTLLLSAVGAALREGNSEEGAVAILHMRADGCELIAHAPGRAAVSREIAETSQSNVEAIARELELARSELRLQPGESAALVLCGEDVLSESSLREACPAFQIISAASLLPKGNASGSSLAVAAAMTAAQQGPAAPLNLLPAERRSYRPPLALTPTYALAGLVILLAVALGLRGGVQDWMYSRHLEREQAALRPQIEELERLQGARRETFDRVAALSGMRNSAGLPLELLDELTRTLPPDAWLQQLQYDGTAVTLSGTAQSASAVLQALSESSYLEAPQFAASLTRTPEGKEVFRIGARLRALNP